MENMYNQITKNLRGGYSPFFQTSGVTNMSDNTENKSPKLDLIGPTDKRVDHKALEALTCARVSLLLKKPFFGSLAARLKLVNADQWLQTLATDGKHFYYNSRFVDMLTSKELEFGFGHEVLHCVYDHMLRRDGRDPKIWNFATDYCVNSDLIKHDVGEKITTIEILYDTKYYDWPAEKVYDHLMENVKYINMDELLDKLLDEHFEPEDSNGSSKNPGTGKSTEGDSGGEKDGGGRPRFTKEQLDEIRDEFREAVINAAQQSNAGDVPNNVKSMIKDLTQPVMDWREMLDMTLTSAMKDDYSWMRSSRRGWHIDAIMPGMTPGEEIDIVVAIDTSGSISTNMLRDFLSEVQGAMESFTSYKIHVFCFDTGYHNPVDFSSDDIRSITEYELAGFGGTDFNAIFDHLKDADIEPERLVVFTDGYP